MVSRKKNEELKPISQFPIEKDSEKAIKLRLQAEAVASSEAATQNLMHMSLEETEKMLHELRVHQIELEMQKDELSRTYAELEASRARYFDLYNLAPVGYFSLNEDGLILESNLTASTMLGLPCKELENKPISHYIMHEDQDVFYHHRRKLFSTGRPQICELRMKKNGDAEDGFFSARLESSVANADSSISASKSYGHECRVIVSDITENLRLAAQFQQAQKMETVGLLAGGVAHDYNNKLAVIIGYAELALNSEISLQTVHIFLEEILKAAQLSASITRQLLTFARKQAIVPVVLDLNQTIESMLKMLRQTVGAEIDLAWRPEVCLHPVKMDPVQIDQILANLCVNARTAIAGIGKITIATGNAAFDELYCIENHGFSEGEYVMIEVSDSGCGMTREVLEQIFEPFFTTREIGQGTGLGLSTVDGIIKQNNGFINVFSEIGVGTTFSIYLPRYTGSMVDRQQENGEATVVGCGETVLIVEDEPALLPLVKMMLEKLGYRVLAVNSPIAAIELVQQQKDRIHLLITDVVMPKMNGCDLAKALQLSFPEMKILFMSGYSANALSLKGVKEGTMNFIQKPFSMKELADKVSKATVSSLSPVQNTNPQ